VSDVGAVSVAEMLDQLIEEIADDAAALCCLPHLQRCRSIVGGGTSADTQLAVFEAHAHSGSPARALRAVTDWIAAATLQ
jgi:carboxylate-amine ligase